MLYRTMKKNGDELSILGFGCMRFPMIEGGAVDEHKAIEQIRYAIDHGVNYLDTAWPYHGGASETILGKALEDGYRDRVKIATKLPTWLIDSREDMDYYLDLQLQKLQAESIDYYLLHALNGHTWDKLEQHGVAAFLDAACADGRIGNAGFSFHGLIEDFKRIIDAYPWIFCQIQYNYLDREYQAGSRGAQLRGRSGYRRHRHGAAARRQSRPGRGARAHRCSLGPGRSQAQPGGVGPALDLERPQGDPRPLWNER